MIGGGIRINHGTAQIENNIISNNSSYICGGGLSITNCLASIRYNFIINNYADFRGGGLIGSSDFLIENNTFYGNNAIRGGGMYITLDENDIVLNNIIWGNTAYEGSNIYLVNEDSFHVFYSNIEDGWPGEGNIDADPLFCDPEGDDFYLAENSPCVGTGFNGANIGAFGIGCDSVGIYDEPYLIPELFSLSPNYPNPFNASTTIKYTLPEPADITIDIYNLLGRKVETLIDGFQPAGAHSVIWQAEGFSSGIYFYKLTAGDYSQTQRMMLLK